VCQLGESDLKFEISDERQIMPQKHRDTEKNEEGKDKRQKTKEKREKRKEKRATQSSQRKTGGHRENRIEIVRRERVAPTALRAGSPATQKKCGTVGGLGSLYR
jgi:hypothetical protein